MCFCVGKYTLCVWEIHMVCLLHLNETSQLKASQPDSENPYSHEMPLLMQVILLTLMQLRVENAQLRKDL